MDFKRHVSHREHVRLRRLGTQSPCNSGILHPPDHPRIVKYWSVNFAGGSRERLQTWQRERIGGREVEREGGEEGWRKFRMRVENLNKQMVRARFKNDLISRGRVKG